MSPDEQAAVLAHVDRMAALTQAVVRDAALGLHRRLDRQDDVLLDHGKRLARIEGGDSARKELFVRTPKPSPSKRLPRWQRVTLSVAVWAGGIATAVGGAWVVIKPLFVAVPKG